LTLSFTEIFTPAASAPGRSTSMRRSSPLRQ
jgi:hypothetical protein